MVQEGSPLEHVTVCSSYPGTGLGEVRKGEWGAENQPTSVLEEWGQVGRDPNPLWQEGCLWLKDFEEGRVWEGVIG